MLDWVSVVRTGIIRNSGLGSWGGALPHAEDRKRWKRCRFYVYKSRLGNKIGIFIITLIIVLNYLKVPYFATSYI